MYAGFAAQFAPDVALPPYGEFDTPEPEAGLEAPENLYDSRGTPLNYIQTQGGPREFLVPRGQAAFAAPPGPTTPQAPMRLRGRGASQARDYTLGPNTDPAPQDLMRPQSGLIPPQPYNGPRARVDIPPDSGMRPDTVVPNWGTHPVVPIPPGPPTHTPQPYNGPRVTARIPQYTRAEQEQRNAEEGIMGSAMNQRTMEDQVANAAMYDRAQQNVRNPAGSIQEEFNAGTAGGLGTLQRLLEDQGSNISNFIDRLRGHGSQGPSSINRSASGAEMESTLRPIANPLRGFSSVDTPPNVTPVTARHGNGPENYNGRAQEVYDLLTQSGIRLTAGAGVRTRNAVAGGHPDGNSIDIPPAQYEQAITIIRQRYPNMPLQPRFIRRGQRFRGGVVATGDHYHVDMGDAALR